MGIPSKLSFPAGLLKVDSLMASMGRYVDADHIRFVKGFPEKIGGWLAWHDTPMPGITRSMLFWQNTDGESFLAVGSTTKLYVYCDSEDEPLDITPIVSSGTLATDPFAVTNGDATIVVTDTAHGLEVGQVVIFSGATAGGGLTLNGTFTVTVVTDANTYEFEFTSVGTSTDATVGGAAVAYQYEIPPGLQDYADVSSGGWGDGGWGEGTWGGGTAGSGEPRVWCFDLWGTTLVSSYNGGTLYDWTPNPASAVRAVAVTGAPASMRGHLVTESRYIVCYGTDDPMSITWQDQNTLTTWTPTATNTAGSRKLQGGTRLIAACRIQSLSNLIWSDTNTFLLTYTGSQFVFDSQIAGVDCGLVGPKAFAMVASTPYWLSPGGFNRFVGYVEAVPRQEEIWDWLLQNVNTDQLRKAWCKYDPSFNEVVWHVPSSSANEPDMYFTVCLDDFAWCHGTMERTAGVVPATGDKRPYLIDEDGQIWRHESGYEAGDDALEFHLASAPIEIEDGLYYYDVNGWFVDWKETTGVIYLTLDSYERVYSDDAPVLESQSGYYDSADPEGVIDFSINGRAIAVTIQSDEAGTFFRMGVPKLDVVRRGSRR